MKRFGLDEIQTDAILDMRLYKLARLEILVVQKETKEKRAEQKELKALLASDKPAGRGPRRDQGDLRSVQGTSGAPESAADARRSSTPRKPSSPTRTRTWCSPRRVAQARARDEGPLLDPAARGRRGAGRSGRVAQVQPGAVLELRHRLRDPVQRHPASTGYGDPVQKLFKFDDQERVVGGLSLDPRLPRPRSWSASRGGGTACASRSPRMPSCPRARAAATPSQGRTTS